MDHTKIIITGGTIDADHIKDDGSYVFTESHVANFIEKFYGKYKPKILMMKDSTKMSICDRELIMEVIKETKHGNVLITHGTDTMCQTAYFLASEKIKKTIVLVGAMTPLNVEPSEACFNLGFAIAQLSTLKRNGVFIAMNGELFHYKNVRKNYEKQCFEKIMEGEN